MATNTTNKGSIPISFAEGINLEAQMQLKELSVSPTEVPAYILIYAKNDGFLYQKLPSGVESVLGGGAGISSLFMKPNEASLDGTDLGADRGTYLLYETIDFSATVKGSIWGSFLSPWDNTKNINCDVYYSLNGLDNTKNILLNGDFWAIANGETPVPATAHDANAYTLSSGTGQNNKLLLLGCATSGFAIIAASIASGDMITFKFWRDAAAGGDTYTGTFQLVGLKFYQAP